MSSLVTFIPNAFIGFVLEALKHPPFMYVSKLAACCAMLFLERSDEELLHAMCEKWATCFIKDRARMLKYAAEKNSQSSYSFEESQKSTSSVDSRQQNWQTDSTDKNEVVKHFLKVLNSLAFMYFSFNWNKTDYVIQVNREYAYYIRDNVLPLCVELTAEEGVEEPAGTSTILSPVEDVNHSVIPFFSPTVAMTRDFRSSGSSQRNSEVDIHHAVEDSVLHHSGDLTSGGDPRQSISAAERSHSSRRQQRRLQAKAQSHITVLRTSNYEEFMSHNTTGRLIVFHGVYCDKSNSLRKVLDAFINRSPITPMPKVGVVYTMSEPRLATLYNISWFPTIIYHLPRSQGPEEGSDSTATAGSQKSFGSLDPHLCQETPIDLSVYAAGSPIHGFTEEIKFLLGKKAQQRVDGSTSERSGEMEVVNYPLLPQLGTTAGILERLEEMHGSCRVFPLNASPTVQVLVQWLRSGGTYVPDGEKESRSMLQTTDELKASLHSAVTLLRRIERAPLPLSVSPSVPQLDGPPVFVFLGGGMAAGKTTALTALSRSSWWQGRQHSAVVVCADEFKPPHFDPRSKEGHQNSTRAAEQLLIQSINQCRDIVLDGTMMWAPFVVQVIQVLRQAHQALFKPGVGYHPDKGQEEYFEWARPRAVPLRLPYKIICIGITVEPDVAVPRGLMRQFSSGRGVPVKEQLKSFKLFSENFPLYVTLVDKMILLNNNIFVDLSKGELPPKLAVKDEGDTALRILDESAYKLFQRHQFINAHADSVNTLYPASPSKQTPNPTLIATSCGG